MKIVSSVVALTALTALTVVFGQDSAKKQTLPTEPYTLKTCPVSGKKLGSMGDPVVKTFQGRQVRFCCNGCVGKFRRKQAAYFKTIDAQLIKAQLPFYPSTTCLVSKESLVEDGKDIGTNVIVGNRLVRLCCDDCKTKITAKPKKYMVRLDAAVKKAQRKAYPLKTCVVSGKKLGTMGKPYEVVLANRLLRLCCKGCVSKLKADPAKYLAKLDPKKHKDAASRPTKRKESAPEHGGKKHDHGNHKH